MYSAEEDAPHGHRVCPNATGGRGHGTYIFQGEIISIFCPLMINMSLHEASVFEHTILIHFGSCFETIHDVSASQLEARESFQNTTQSESNSFTSICMLDPITLSLALIHFFFFLQKLNDSLLMKQVDMQLIMNSLCTNCNFSNYVFTIMFFLNP